MATVPAEAQDPSDGELIEAVRHGSTEAYGQLYERHVHAARNMAKQVAHSTTDADDLVSEAFTKVLNTLRAGNGPKTSFRAYLLTTLRHTAYDRSRRESKVQLTENLSAVSATELTVPFIDPAVDELERNLITQAFTRLPERWQAVLWHVDIEGEPPATVAPLLGLTPNAVSALVYRAREGLRQAYLQAHLGQLDDSAPGFQQCRATTDRLGTWTRGALSRRETAQVEAHLDACQRCRGLAAELANVNEALRGVLAPIVLGTAALGYLAASAETTGASGATLGAASTSTVSRQTAMTGMSCAALVAAVALALSAAPQPLGSLAVPPPPAAPSEPTPPQPAKPTPEPAPPKPPPTPPPSPAQAPPDPPLPALPKLEASWSAEPVELIAGGDPRTLRVLVNNDGAARSAPVSVHLTLPAGVSADLPTSRSGDLSCAQLDNGVRCTAVPGIDAGAAVTFDFAISAAEEASGGEIVADVSAGNGLPLRLPMVPVSVQPPEPVDDVDIEATAVDQPARLTSRIELDVRNTGTSTGEAVTLARIPENVHATGMPPECELLSLGSRWLRCSAELKPGDSYHGVIWLTALPGEGTVEEVEVDAKAKLAAATDTDSVDVELFFPGIRTECDQSIPGLPIEPPDCLLGSRPDQPD